MPKYKIYRNYGYVGTSSYEVIEANDEQEAEEAARDFAFDRVEFWAEPLEDKEEE